MRRLSTLPARNPRRRKNPMFYREPGSTSAFSPVTGQRLRTMLAAQSPGSHPLEYFGEDEHFWSPERVKEVLDANPALRRHFENPEEAVKAVLAALETMVAHKTLPDLLPAGDAGVRVSALASAVPLVRELGKRTTLLESGSSRATPYFIGFVNALRQYQQGLVIQVPPFGQDFGPETVNPYVAVNMVRPFSRRLRVGDVGYRVPPSGYEGRLFDYGPVLVTETSTFPGAAQRLRVQTILPDNRLGDEAVLGEWQVLRADEMPPHGAYRRVDPSIFAPMPSPQDATSAREEKGRRAKPKVAAVVSPSGAYLTYVVLFDPAVLVRGELSEQDVLGFATATVVVPPTGFARISVAAAEPGYAYLMYAILAKHIASQHPGTQLQGSYQQTEYAKRFWARQPNGAIASMAPADFKRTFGMTYASGVAAGDELAQRLAKALNVTDKDARERLRSLGSAYFDDYYGVSSTASNRLGPDRLRRPASPRETVEAVRKVSSRKLASRDLALVVEQSAFSGSIKGYLFTVPKGKSTLTPASLLAVWDIRRPTQPGARFGDFADDLYGPLAASKRTPEGEAVMQVLREFNTDAETPRTRREAKKWAARGEALKVALANAGQTNLRAYLEYLDKAARNYGERASRIESAGKRKLNPRRDKLAVRIFMPV